MHTQNYGKHTTHASHCVSFILLGHCSVYGLVAVQDPFQEEEGSQVS